MPYLSTASEIAPLLELFPGSTLNELFGVNSDDAASGTWLADALDEYTLDSCYSVRENDHQDAVGIALGETSTPLPRLAAGAWRSLGGCLDYSGWKDRDRFLQLDKAIASAACPRDSDRKTGNHAAPNGLVPGYHPEFTP
jgi:hypothetical protein